MIKFFSMFNTTRNTHTFTAEVETGSMLERYRLFDIMKTIDNKIASHCARIYIKHRRAEIERFIMHPATQKRIAREVKKLLDQQI